MSAFARWLQGYRSARIGAIVVTLLLPLTNVVSAAILVMAARRAGWRSAALDAGASLVLLAVLAQLASGGDARAAPGPALLGAAALWGAAIVGGGVLRRYRSVDLALQVLVMMTLAGFIAASLLVPDARAYWQPVLEALIKEAGLPQVGGLPEGWLAMVAALMHGVISAGLLSTLVLAVMLALWLDGEPAESGWRRQFLGLRLGRVLSVAAILAAGLFAAGFVSFGGGALLVLGTAFMMQGLAIVHWTADQRSWPKIWPVALYAPLLLGAPPAGLLMLALTVAGLVDNAFSLRRRRPNVV